MTLDNQRAVFAAQMEAKPAPRPIRFHPIEVIDELKSGQWWLWSCTADMSDGSERHGTIQGGHEFTGVVEPSTWEEDNE